MLIKNNWIEILSDSWPNLALFSFIVELNSQLTKCESVLDLGCGSISPVRYLVNKKRLVGVDGHKDSIETAKKRKTHDKLITMDVRSISKKFGKNSFDAVIALDLIEHLEKSDGKKLLKDMERIAKKKVVILTPNGYIHQEDKGNELQEHLSGWEIKDFENLGYTVKGMYGLKHFRGEEAKLKSPKIVFGVFSLLSHLLITRYFTRRSFSLLVCKCLDDS